MTREEKLKQKQAIQKALNNADYNKILAEALSESKPITDDMWQEFESQLLREIHTPMTMDYDSSIRMAEMGIKDVVNRWKKRFSEPTKPTTITENMTNGDVISRETVKELLDEYYAELTLNETALKTNAIAIKVTRHIINDIEVLPSATSTRPKAKWIDHDKHIECSRCKVWFLKDHIMPRNNYCPNCGAEMESE